ncbi:MAG: PEP-CTERM sorting domain-containing protein [Planctomycetes bacterium]|nr:PEP-CTERM sorting domain-containing protein [Planctomycetota bacterium]
MRTAQPIPSGRLPTERPLAEVKSMKRKILPALFAYASIAVFGAAARADFASGGSVFSDAGGIVTGSGGTIGAVDGSYFLGAVNGTGFTQQILYDATWSTGQTHPRFEIAVGSITGTVTIDEIDLLDAGGTNGIAYVFAVPAVLTAGVNIIDVNVGDPLNLIFGTGFSNYTTASFTFSASAGSSVQFDAVANPEPGTLSLFGVGAVALGIWVRRKRRSAMAEAAAR